MFGIENLVKAIDRLVDVIRPLIAAETALSQRIERLTQLIRTSSRTPGPISLQVLKEDNNMLVFRFKLPPLGAYDVVKRRLSVTVGANGTESTVEIADPEINTLLSGEYKGNDNDPIHAVLTDIDDAGNESIPREGDWVLTDTLAPNQPDAFGVEVLREDNSLVPDPDADPDAPVDPDAPIEDPVLDSDESDNEDVPDDADNSGHTDPN